MPGEFAQITKQDLFARLAQGHAEGITVVTPNRRLAQVLRAEFVAFQTARKIPAWEDADILPLPAFCQRLYEDALYAEPGAGLPQLLAPAQERAIWESVLAGAPLLSVAQTAANCADAWRLAHAWRIDGALEKFARNEDTQAFAGWAREYSRRCGDGGFADAAVLPDLVLKSRTGRPTLLVAHGFDILPPQTVDFFRGLGAETVSCRTSPGSSKAVKASFASARHELQAAAQWARARLEAGIAEGKSPRIGIVVPDLQLRRKEVARVFADVMRPGWNLPGAGAKAMPFDISIGAPLAEYPIVDSALAVLGLGAGEFEFTAASRLIRSPFLGGADTEFAARALLDARLRETLPPRLTLPKLIGSLEGRALLRTRLELLYGVMQEIPSRTRPPHDWARHFTELLGAAGFPGERTLDSDEFQARARFNEILGEFSRLGFLTGSIFLPEALRQLRRLCADTLFQPETPEAPVQVAGILESAGLEYDCLWVSGLTEDAWPLAARANPFLPVALQKKAGIPEAAAETSLALDRRITEGWLGAAGEVVFSHPAKEKDRDLLPSPLIAAVPAGTLELPSFAPYRDVLFASRAIEFFEDEKGGPLASGNIRSGVRVLTHQAACPFRAFARHRLGAEGLASPGEGLDAMERGNLLHLLMAGIWKEVRTRGGLGADLAPVISRAAEKAVNELKIEGRLAQLEKTRLEKLAREWLALERQRGDFEVVAIEQPRPLQIGGLSFNGRIDRMDRLLEGEMRGAHVLIDYKTGAQLTPQMWLGERPDEPQLPLYAVSAREDVGAVAFARLKTGSMRFMGFSRAKNAVPEVKPIAWDGLLGQWKVALEGLAAGYAGGDARVDPKRGLATCRNCDLQPLCRVHERLSALEEHEEGEE